MPVIHEEIFGPVVRAIPFTPEEDVLLAANDTTYGLAAAAVRATSAGRTGSRRKPARRNGLDQLLHVFDAAMPFGGYKQSGWGREMGKEALDNYLETKSVVTQLA